MHLTDDQLNEYLDNETTERAQIASHLESCADCAARLTALQALFDEIESLPDVELVRPLAASLAPRALPLPRWLTLTATLQAAFALTVLFIAAPFVLNLLPAIETPSFTDVILRLQSQWTAWLDILSTLQLPTFPQLPPLEISSLVLSLSLAATSLLWLVGNGLLLRKQIK